MSINNILFKKVFYFILSVVCIFIICLFVYAYRVDFFKLKDFASFHVSFFASAAEDLLFFIIIGSGLVFYTLKKPEDENLEARIGFLFSGKHSTPAARQHALDLIRKHACISPASKIVIRIDSYDSEMDAFKVITEWYYTLANMYKDHTYKDKQVPLVLSMDELKKEVEFYGEVESIKTTNNVPKKSINDHIIAPIKINNLTFTKNIKLEIEPNSTIDYDVRFWHYCRLGVGYNLDVTRYTHELNVTLLNASDSDVFL